MKMTMKKKPAVVEDRRGAVFFSNLPHGFYERALDGYLRQFGDIRRIKIAKSLKNAKPMGYAYVEFEHEKVALIVAKTMNKYLMFKKLLKCQFIKHDDLNFKMWANADITPELCPGTIKKRRNQYLLQSGSSKFYSLKKKAQGEKMKNYIKNTLGLKLVEGNQKTKKIRMELEDNDEEISIRTPPNVVKVRKNKDRSNGVKPLLCDGDATTVKMIIRKRRSTSLEPVSKELFSKIAKDGKDKKKLKLDYNNEVTSKVEKKSEKKTKIRQTTKTVLDVSKPDEDSLKHKAKLSKRKSVSNAKPINNKTPNVEGTIEKKTSRKRRQSPISLKKIIDDNIFSSTNEENSTPKKQQSKMTKKSPATHVEKKNATNLASNKSSNCGSNVNTPLKYLSKKGKIAPTLDKIEIKNFEKKTSRKRRQSPISLKKIIDDNIFSSTNENSTPKKRVKRQSKMTKNSPATQVEKKNATNLASNKSSNCGSNVNTPLKNLSKKAKIAPTLNKIEIKNFENLLQNKTPRSSKKVSKDILTKVSPRPSFDVSKKITNSSKKFISAQKLNKVVVSERKDKLGDKEKRSLSNSFAQCTTVQNKKNRRASLGVKAAVSVKTPKTNRVRSKQKIHLPESV